MMPGALDKAFGVHAQALVLRSQRSEVLASNIAHADTPGYKAKDIEFESVLQSVNNKETRMKVTNPRHIATSNNSMGSGEVRERKQIQPSLDGNTVDMQREQAAFAKNAIEYQTSLTFLGGTIKSLMKAIRGD